ncbi:fumarylacetoacetate hydrolase family protein [Ruegeria sp.]|uniref:fumarylacetoacetate hydrolase family protein n=1 Tax=Ruegeria sp. TaxID=1879320 RepID=UPI00232444F1|nr:fumarylacetoacetate hydrolase family protein [Ruegeria sp.]MDA7963648.1 fumarylacetoacetate hydrolase family protein [Ruegeria sp.]
MKLLSFEHEGRPTWGVRSGDAIANVGAVLGSRFATLKDLLGTTEFIKVAQAALLEAPVVALPDIRLLPPIPNPDKIICVGLNYEDHRVETQHLPTIHPTLFSRFAASQCAHGDAMIVPKTSDQLDFEAELVAVIGQDCFEVPEEDALSKVAGYSCYNDGSVRDWQTHTTQFLPGKNFPATGAFGPYLVTADEIGDPQNLAITCRLNGTTVQSARTDQMVHSVARQIAYITQFTSLTAGDLIVTGTPGGVGFTRTPPLYLKDGDLVEVEIEKVGLLRNPVKASR